jgi:N-acetylglucosamine-6-sulfatase
MGIRSWTGRRLAILVVVALVTGLAVAAAASRTAPGASAASAAQTRPNIVVIETDDQTDDSLRFMANVNRLLVQQGVRFDNNYASFPLCCPSRSTFLTGQYAHNHGVMGNAPPQGGFTKLDHSNTLAVWLQRAGYYTAHVGKYLNGYGTPDTRSIVPAGWSEWHGATSLPYLGFTLNEGGQLNRYPANQANYQTDVFGAKAVDIIRRQTALDTPLFMWVAFFAPHSGGPRDPDDPAGTSALRGPSPAERHRNAFASQALPQPPSFNEADVSDKPASVRNRRLLNATQIRRIQEMYQQRLESLLAVDEGVANIVEALRASGELERTLIIFTSDNGFMHGEHRIPSGKVVVYEPSARVPLVLRGPGVSHGPHVSDVVSNIDLAPTILAAAKVKAGRVMDGRSLLPLAGDRLADYGRDLLLETPNYAAIHTSRYVWVEYGSGERELYDLKTDPNQLVSRHADPSLARVRDELARRLAALRNCSGAFCRRGPRVTLGVTRTRKAVRLRVTGADADWVSSVRFYLNGRQIAADARSPFRKLVARSRFGSSRFATVRVHVQTSDGRGVTLARRARVR